MEISNIYKNIDNIPEDVLISIIMSYGGSFIKNIQNPSENVQLTAVSRYGYAIQFINNPSVQCQMAAVNKDPWSIQFIQNPHKDVLITSLLKLLQYDIIFAINLLNNFSDINYPELIAIRTYIENTK